MARTRKKRKTYPYNLKPGDHVQLDKEFAFLLPGIYRFDGIFGPFAQFSVGLNIFGINSRFLGKFKKISAPLGDYGMIMRGEQFTLHMGRWMQRAEKRAHQDYEFFSVSDLNLEELLQ